MGKTRKPTSLDSTQQSQKNYVTNRKTVIKIERKKPQKSQISAKFSRT